MGTGSLKTIVVLILLSVLAFAAGSMASEGVKQALLPVGILMGAVTLLCLGRHCWVCAYAAAPILAALGFPTKVPIPFVIGSILLVYWLIMYTLGHVKITWHKLPILDIAVFVFSAYLLFCWVRNPVTLELMRNPITDPDKMLIGGVEYVYCIFAVLFYIYISIVPMNFQILGRLLKTVFFIALIFLIIRTVTGLGRPPESLQEPGMEMQLEEEMVGTRFVGFLGLGKVICNYLVCQYAFTAIVCSPWKLAMYTAGALGVALSGFRSYFLEVLLVMFFMQVIYRKVVSLIVLGIFAYGGLLLLGAVGAIQDLPYGTRRVLTAVPGLEVGGAAARGAQGSLDWRYEMWGWALDPSTGYIKDYVWGDGYGLNVRKYKLRIVAEKRGTYINSNRDFAADGQWHSGWLTAIHRTGIVGLCLIVMLHVVNIVCTLRVAMALKTVPNCGYMYYYIVPGIASSIMFYISAGTLSSILATYSQFVMVKVLTSLAVKDGLMLPMFQRKVYVPMIQREIEQAAAAGHAPAASRA